MALLKLARLGHPVLRQVAQPVPPRSIRGGEVQRLIEDMIETMREEDGVGLAAPQVHVSRRLLVYQVLEPPAPGQAAVPLTVLINPTLTPVSEEQEEDWEGCLSLPELRGRVPRWARIQVEAWDREARHRRFTARGFHARVIQHECDHLDGKVFVDRMRDMSSLAFLPEFVRFQAAGA